MEENSENDCSMHENVTPQPITEDESQKSASDVAESQNTAEVNNDPQLTTPTNYLITELSSIPPIDLSETSKTQILTFNNESKTITNDSTSKSSSLRLLMGYESDESSESEASSDESTVEIIENTSTRQERRSSFSTNSGDSDDDSSDLETRSVISITSTTSTVRSTKKKNKEFTIDDLPPVPDLSTLTIKDEETFEFVRIGTVMGIIGKLVTVNSLPNLPAYDIDTLFYLDAGKMRMGFVFDVMGSVSEPMYVVRFNDTQDIENIGLKKGDSVYTVPKSDYTQYVFVKQLMAVKGTDGPTLSDDEGEPEFSDDEAERNYRMGRAPQTGTSSNAQPSTSTGLESSGGRGNSGGFLRKRRFDGSFRGGGFMGGTRGGFNTQYRPPPPFPSSYGMPRFHSFPSYVRPPLPPPPPHPPAVHPFMNPMHMPRLPQNINQNSSENYYQQQEGQFGPYWPPS